MNDPLSIARRLIGYAAEPGISEQKREDLLAAADMARVLYGILNARDAIPIVHSTNSRMTRE